MNNPATQCQNPEGQKQLWYYRQNHMFSWKRRENDVTYPKKGKVFPLQARCGPEGG